MIIVDLPCFAIISAPEKTRGGQNNYYDNKAAATALTYAEGLNTAAAAGTSVYLDRGISKAQSFSKAQSLG
jgi:hypothetical protein